MHKITRWITGAEGVSGSGAEADIHTGMRASGDATGNSGGSLIFRYTPATLAVTDALSRVFAEAQITLKLTMTRCH